MDYYRLLNLNCEPFSTSPDPHFFYLSRAHRSALFRVRIAIELRRGLSIVAGDIGTGKSTLARKLSQVFFEDKKIDFHAILNPVHHDNEQFLRTLLNTFHIPSSALSQGPMNGLHEIEKYLYQKGLREKKTVVLLIDEAQLLSEQALEVLRALLNYETNEFKLLQLVLVGQLELASKLRKVPNFWDRISLKVMIPPLTEKETEEMITYRLRQAGYLFSEPLFTQDAVRMIYEQSQGYPRRINMLCHEALTYLVMMDQRIADDHVIAEMIHAEDHFTQQASKSEDVSRSPLQPASAPFCETPETIQNGLITPAGYGTRTD